MIEVPETEVVTNLNMLSLMEVAKEEKSSSIQLLVSPDYSHKVSFEKNSGFANGYYKTLENWIKDPHNLKDGRSGYPLEILYKELLSQIFPEQIVCLAPSSLDNRVIESLPPADILIGDTINHELLNPLLLISSKFGKGNKSEINPLLNTPEITLNAQKIFGKKKALEIISNFATTDSINDFIQEILNQYAPKLQEKILNGLNRIDKKNIIEDKYKQKRILNKIVARKTLYLREILSQ